MPSPMRTLTGRTARELISELSFPPASGERVGVEIEWFTTPSSAPPDVTVLREILEPLLPLPCGSALTFEPGGQVELSSQPHDNADLACAAVAADAERVRAELSAHGIGVFAGGMDPDRPSRLLTTEPRYVAMRAHLDEQGTAGARMMCTTAAVHINIDAGRDRTGARRWRLAHSIGPVLVASFANSPLLEGRQPGGWKSSRMATWMAMDPTRAGSVPTDGDPENSWAVYAIGANVMFIRSPEGFVPIKQPFPFERWIDEGHELGFPTADDLAYHLTTLFPPVRPHGWLELRMIDMVPDPWWRAAVGAATALLYDAGAANRAESATRPVQGMWREAARYGLDHPDLRAAAEACFDAACDALERDGNGDTADAVRAFSDRYPRRGRCPADDDPAIRAAGHRAEAI